MKVAIAAMLNPMRGAALSQKNGNVPGSILQTGQQNRRDHVSISGVGRNSKGGAGQDSTLKMLMDQKEYLSQKRDSLLKEMATTEGDHSFIKDKIKDLGKQLSNVNQQVADYLLQKQKEALEAEKGKSGGEQEKLTPEELRQKQMETLTQAVDDLSTMDQMRRTRKELIRSTAWEQDASENVYSLSAAGVEAEIRGDTVRLDKMEAGIQGLEQSEQDLLEQAQELTEDAAALGLAAAEAEATTPAEEIANDGDSTQPTEGKQPTTPKENQGQAVENTETASKAPVPKDAEPEETL